MPMRQNRSRVVLRPWVPWPHAELAANAEILESLSQAAKGRSLVYICNPNNPTGRFISTKELQQLISLRREATWVVDESYAPFVAPDLVSSKNM